MSVFVNPLQFGPKEDFSRYPRDLDQDRGLAAQRGVDCLFAPDRAAMYPGEPLVRMDPGSMAERFEGAVRPGHFAGVLTVVAKLFHLVEPDVAVFGRKDFQQAMLIRRMARDLDFPLDILIAPTVRELDGLALSSRNAYLNADQRRMAWASRVPCGPSSNSGGVGDADPGSVRTQGLLVLSAAGVVPDYLALVDEELPGRRARVTAHRSWRSSPVQGWSHAAARQRGPGRGRERRSLEPQTVTLPSWAVASPERRAHVERVAVLIDQWAAALQVPDGERRRWAKAAWLHDALRDAPAADELAHGPASADRAAREGESDSGVLDAVRYHSLGHARWDDVGRMLYLGDYLEPGRKFDRDGRAALAARVPVERDAVLIEVARLRIAWTVQSHWTLAPETVEFWNSLVAL